MTDIKDIKKDAEVIGADGVHVGTVDHVSHDRIKLTKKDSSDGHHHYVDSGLVASVEMVWCAYQLPARTRLRWNNAEFSDGSGLGGSQLRSRCSVQVTTLIIAFIAVVELTVIVGIAR